MSYGIPRNVDFKTFLFLVSAGRLPGWSFVEKFGENNDIGPGDVPEDIWQYGGTYSFSVDGVADINTLSSSSAADTQLIRVYGQTADNVEIIQDVTLSGQSKVSIPTPLHRVYRMYNTNSSDIQGAVYCYVDGTITNGVPDTASSVRAVIEGSNNQTEMCIYTVPANRIGWFLGGFVSTSRVGNNSAICTWERRDKGGVFRLQSRVALNGSGANQFPYAYPIPLGPMQAGTDLKLSVKDVDAINTGVSGGFTILLKHI
jgi:hypothetical protein